jgi:CHAD domain-containing protein
VKRTYRDGARASARARAEPTVENLHEWRKQVKYLWHQLQLLEPVRPDVLKELTDRAHDLGDLLGDDHDLAILGQVIMRDVPNREEHALGTLLSLIDRRRAELQARSYPLGEQVYADSPRGFVKRIRGYWREWRSQSASAPAAS